MSSHVWQAAGSRQQAAELYMYHLFTQLAVATVDSNSIFSESNLPESAIEQKLLSCDYNIFNCDEDITTDLP
jgi:hypothetical protein